MDTREAIARRIRELCRQRGITPNGLATTSAVPQATIKSILNGESKNPGAVTIKKLCDGFEITLGEFFQRRNSMRWSRKSNRREKGSPFKGRWREAPEGLRREAAKSESPMRIRTH